MINVFIGYEQGQDFNSKCAHSLYAIVGQNQDTL